MANQRRYLTPWALGIFVAVTVCALAITHYLRLSPQEVPAETSNEPQSTASPVAVPEISVRSGASATALGGSYTIRVNQISGSTVNLTVSSERQDVYRFNKAEVGRRLVVPAPDATYYVDLLRVRGNTVYLTMSKR